MWDNAALLRNIANTLLLCSVLAALYGAAYYLLHLPGLLPLKSVHLDAPPQRVDADALLVVARGEARGNLLTVDIEHLRRALEKLPWVRGVTIRREFPGSLAVQLEEHEALARWNGKAWVNTYGEVFDAPGAQVLPDFIGPDGASAEVAQHYAQFSAQLAALDMRIAQLALTPRHAWQLHLAGGLVLELGREQMQQRLARFVAVQRTEGRRLRTEAVAYVDLRYRNGFAVRRMVEGRKLGTES